MSPRRKVLVHLVERGETKCVAETTPDLRTTEPSLATCAGCLLRHATELHRAAMRHLSLAATVDGARVHHRLDRLVNLEHDPLEPVYQAEAEAAEANRRAVGWTTWTVVLHRSAATLAHWTCRHGRDPNERRREGLRLALQALRHTRHEQLAVELRDTIQRLMESG